MIKQQCILAIRYLAIYFGYIHGMRVNSNSANGLTRFSVPLHLKPLVATLHTPYNLSTVPCCTPNDRKHQPYRKNIEGQNAFYWLIKP